MTFDTSNYVTFGIITVLGLLIKAIWTKVSKIPSNDDIEVIRVAVSGVRQYIEQTKKEDFDVDSKQWAKIDDINARLGKVEGMLEMLSKRGLQ